MKKFKPIDLRVMSVTDEQRNSVKRNPVYIILDNVLDTYNIGSVFRLADAVGAKKILLCGGTETPPNHRIKKASINTTEWVEWKYYTDTKDAIRDLKSQIPGISIVAVEQDAKSTPYDKTNYNYPIALVVGHETDGISREVLDLCDEIVEIPMWGVNTSMNVMVSLAIVLFEVVKRIPD